MGPVCLLKTSFTACLNSLEVAFNMNEYRKWNFADFQLAN